MKKKFVSFIAILFLSLQVFAVNKTAVTDNNDTDWDDASNWSPTGVPQNGDLITIPAGLTINIKGKLYNGVENLVVNVYGRMNFEPSGQLDLGINSIIRLMTTAAQVTSHGSASEIIRINDVVKYNGQVNGTISGVATASSAPGGFVPGFPLPIALTRFVAQGRQHQVVLSWQTATEQQARHFELERSTNGVSWQRLAIVPVTGSHSSYTYTDAAPQAGDNQYRLKLVDANGTFMYSSIVKATTERVASLQLAPNPARGFLNVALSAPATNLAFQIVSSNGRVEKTFTASNNSVARLDLSGLNSGPYYLVIQSNGQVVETRGFVVK